MSRGKPNKRYTPEFKKMVVETMEKEQLSIYATMQEFGINDHKIIERWERIYLEEGPEGLAIKRRGRGSTGRPKKLPKDVEEDLLAEVQRLRAENDYLKNLQALVLEDERRQRRKRR
ncbi:transposase [Agathobaculum sp.]|uniref:transposase n=1 Tax=Agathobaculum sp. TaxID=2048138 RepID=UPI003A90DA0E